MIKYYPYKSDRPTKKYYIITNENKKVYFGQAGASDFTIHKDEARKQRYINRHKNNEIWTKSGINTSGFWSRLREKQQLKKILNENLIYNYYEIIIYI